MEWIETTGRTVDEAKEAALDRLGVAPDDAEFEVVDEPRPGLFGRTRGEARVRARVRPTHARQKVDRRRRTDERGRGGSKGARTESAEASGETQDTANTSRSNNHRRGTRGRGQRATSHDAPSRRAEPATRDAAGAETSPVPPVRRESNEMDAAQVGAEAQRFMEGLLSAFGATGTIELVQDGVDLELRVHGEGLGLLVGPRGTTLQAVQELARVAAQRRLGDHDTRLRVDVGGYRERRREALGAFAQQMADEVRDSGVARVLEPMSSADRKVIHDALSTIAGIETRSEGEDPNRRVVIAPAPAPDA